MKILTLVSLQSYSDYETMEQLQRALETCYISCLELAALNHVKTIVCVFVCYDVYPVYVCMYMLWIYV